MSVTRILALALSSALALGVSAGVANAASTFSTSVGTSTAAWTENTTGIGAGVALSIDPKGPGPADDRLLSTLAITGGGCTLSAGFSSCPLGNGTVAFENLVVTVSGNTSTYNLYLDVDRPGFRMRTVLTASSQSGATVDGSATAVGPIVATGFYQATGGGDDDALTGTDGANTLTGGPGDDALTGRKGNDILTGGPGDDILSPGEGAVESADGGEGSQDTLSAAAENGPANLTLDGAVNDSVNPGQVLTMAGIENLAGSDGNDTLVGDAGFNHIYGGPGNDQVNGNGGGHDVLRGNAGDDVLTARDAAALFSDVACGGGTDTAIVDAADLVASDCETTDRAPAPSNFVAPTFPGGPPVEAAAGGGSGGGAAGGTGAANASTAGPVLTVDAPKSTTRSGLRKGVKVTVSSAQTATITVELVTTAKSVRLRAVPKDNLTIARSTKRNMTAAQRFTLRPDAALTRGLKRATIRVTAVGAGGTPTVVQQALKVR